MFARALYVAYAVVCYGVFQVSFLYALGFFGDVVVPKTIDFGGETAQSTALAVDAGLFALFALQHSVMARTWFKRWQRRLLPTSAERSTYVLLSSLLLLLLFWQWRPIPTVIWRAEGIVGGFLTGLYWFGWLIVLGSTFMIDHFDLFGLKQQAYATRKAAETASPTFRERWLYRFVRHPLMLGFLIAFWATAVMTIGHLAFSLMTTAYILIALQWEERDLIAEFGETYEKYRARTPMLLPFSRFRRRSPSERTAPRARSS